MVQQAIAPADLRAIENNLATIYQNIRALDTSVSSVDSNVRVVYDELGSLTKDFKEYVFEEKRRWELEHATTKLGNIRQELETRYGHYAEVRRTTTGILQATDLGVIRNESITSAAEDLMLTCPDYWLAPCLVALAAWINDEKDIAERALKAGIQRDDEKTSLLFALICRRADRKNASMQWVKRYLAGRDPENLSRETVVVLDAYASGLFAMDSENAIANQLAEWLEILSVKPGFLEQQTDRWKLALNNKRKPLPDDDYKYLRQYSHTWPILKDIMEGARLHQITLEYFEGVFALPSNEGAVKQQLDGILSSLVSGFDDEELPLRREERLQQLIIDFDGDTGRANASASAEKSVLEEEKDFTQLLTDAAMYPEIAHSSASSQKFAIAYSREWIINAYNDLTAENRAKIPNEIEINIDTFNERTRDGADEDRLVTAFNNLITSEENAELEKVKMSAFEEFCKWGGVGCLAAGAIALIFAFIGGGFVSGLIGVLAAIGGIGMLVKFYSRKKFVELKHQQIKAQFEEKREKGLKILKATLAEVVDFRIEFDTKDKESGKVINHLEQISADQYIKKLSGSTRRVDSQK